MIIRCFVFDRNHPGGPEYFHPLIVAVNSLAAIIYGSQRAIIKRERHNRRVPIMHLLENWIDQYVCLGIDLFDIARHKKASHIKVMNCHVQENSTGGAEVIFWRRSRIATGNSEDLRLADSSCFDHLA